MKHILVLSIFFVVHLNAQNVGINTTSPNTALDVNGDLALRITNLSVNSGLNNNVNTSSSKRSFYRVIDATGDFTITGVDGGSDGRIVTLVNNTTFTMTLVHESSNSSPNNRFVISGDGIYEILPKASVTLQYSIIDNRWIFTGNSNVENKVSWKLTGNSGTNAATHFIGTTDAAPISFRQNNQWVGRFNSDAFRRQYFIGSATGQNATTGNSNVVAIGDSSFTGLYGYNTVAIGSNALKENTSGLGYENVAVGHNTMRNATTSNSVAVGNNAMRGINTTDQVSNNVAIGASSLMNNRGERNTASGFNSLRDNLGFENTAIGYKTLEKHTTGNDNVALGATALVSNITGQSNTALGSSALASDVSSSNNVAVGRLALYNSTNNNGLVAVGYEALRNNGIGAASPNLAEENTGVGFQALYGNSLGRSNTALGFKAMYSSGSGNRNTAVGTNAMGASGTTGSFNTAVGNEALRYTSDNGNTAIGDNAMGGTYAKNGNVAVGAYAGYLNRQQNMVAVGDSALYNNGASGGASEGMQNTAIGSKSLQNNNQGSYNTALGFQSMRNNGTGSGNTAVGDSALFTNTSGSRNVSVGIAALNKNNIGSSNVAVGKAALFSNVSSANNIAIGENALYSTTNNNNVAIGVNAANANVTGINNTALGNASLSRSTNNNGLVAVGYEALFNNGLTGVANQAEENTGVGYQSLYSNQSSRGNTAVGFRSMFNSNNGGNYNTALGANAMGNSTSAGGGNTAVGNNALKESLTSFNTAIGNGALATSTLGANNTAVGSGALAGSTSGANNTAVGVSALGNGNAKGGNVAVGALAAFFNTQKNIVAIGDSALLNNAISGGTSDGLQNTAVGSKALESNNQGSYNTALGFQAMRNNSFGSGNTALGDSALFTNSSGSRNLAAGVGALNKNNSGSSNIALGNGALSTNMNGNSNVAVGDYALNSTTNGNNVAVGASAGSSNTSGSNNTAIGFNANFSQPNLSNATAIGANASVNTNNALVLGNAAKVGIGTSTPVDALTVARVPGNVATARFGGTTWSTEINTGANEDTYIRAGTNNGNIYINPGSNGSNEIGSYGGAIGTTTNVYGQMYGYYTGGGVDAMNIIPLGVVSYEYKNPGVQPDSFIVRNIVGNLAVDKLYHTSGTIVSRVDGYIALKDAVTTQFTDVIAIGQPGYNDLTSGPTLYYLMALFSQMRTNVIVNGTTYNKVYHWQTMTDGVLTPQRQVKGTVIFYGIK
jgi:trimeric autotransporter adhesin